MNPKKVSNATDLLQAASPVASEESMRRVLSGARRWKRWLGRKHQYNETDMTEALRGQSINGPQLGEYIACSAPLHLLDGWIYISRAFDAASRGDRNSAVHMAYYAELRAAMSLLATRGVGIFNQSHVALDDQMQPTQLGRSTHKATWELLMAWSLQSDSAEKILRAIPLETRSLSDWLAQVGVVAPSRDVVAREWLRAWSVDLEVFDQDRSRRNESSYRPTRISTAILQPVDAHVELAGPLFNSWLEISPTITGAYAAIDVSLLRQALTLALEKGLSHYVTLDGAINALQDIIPPDSTSNVIEALKSSSLSAHSIFCAADEPLDPQGPATPILARGLLMLRLATACSTSLLEAADVSKSDLQFWWAPLGTDLGLWDNGSDVETFADLWIDVENAIDRANEELSNLQGGCTVRDVAKILTRDMSLTQFSRAPMWLLGLE